MDLEIYGVSAVLIIIGIVQLAKSVGFNSKYGGVLAVVLGVTASFGYTFFNETNYFKAIIVGLALGLSAAGLYSTTKNAKE
jgi:pyruvate/2-oxoglutarate/acetoin dehydrogenase E1 component